MLAQVNESNNVKSVLPTVSVKATCGCTEVQPLNRLNLKSLLESQADKIFSVDFFKLDGVKRSLTGRLGVKAYLQGGKNTVVTDERPYITVFDLQLLQYRTVNLATVASVKADGKVYQVVG